MIRDVQKVDGYQVKKINDLHFAFKLNDKTFFRFVFDCHNICIKIFAIVITVHTDKYTTKSGISVQDMQKRNSNTCMNSVMNTVQNNKLATSNYPWLKSLKFWINVLKLGFYLDSKDWTDGCFVSKDNETITFSFFHTKRIPIHCLLLRNKRNIKWSSLVLREWIKIFLTHYNFYDKNIIAVYISTHLARRFFINYSTNTLLYSGKIYFANGNKFFISCDYYPEPEHCELTVKDDYIINLKKYDSQWNLKTEEEYQPITLQSYMMDGSTLNEKEINCTITVQIHENDYALVSFND